MNSQVRKKNDDISKFVIYKEQNYCNLCQLLKSFIFLFW